MLLSIWFNCFYHALSLRDIVGLPGLMIHGEGNRSHKLLSIIYAIPWAKISSGVHCLVDLLLDDDYLHTSTYG